MTVKELLTPLNDATGVVIHVKDMGLIKGTAAELVLWQLKVLSYCWEYPPEGGAFLKIYARTFSTGETPTRIVRAGK